MDSAKNRGRPTQHGVKAPWQFRRVLMVVHEYDKARKRGEKHTAAMQAAVDYLRQHEPKMPISTTAVRRVLAEFRPKDNQLALAVSLSIADDKELARRRNLRAQVPGFAGTDVTAELTDSNRQSGRRTYKFGFVERPNYARHNAKTPNA
jgi:hypothetical protein